MKRLLFIPLLLLVFSCKKDKTNSAEGNFLCEITEEYDYTSNNSDVSYDYVMELIIDGDSIVFDEYTFPLSSFNLETGTGSHTQSLFNNGHATLTLANGFNSITFHELIPSNLAGPTWTKTITGTRTTLVVPTETNNPLFDLAGNYSLYVQSFENYNSIDTNYTGVFPVSFDATNMTLVVNGTARSLQPFHSHYNKVSYWNGGPYEHTINDVYWSADSLYFHFHDARGLTWPPSDTTHYHYQGVKQ